MDTDKVKNQAIDPKMEKFIEDFYLGSSKDLEEFRLLCEKEYIPIIRRETESFLKDLLRTVKPVNLLEIGTGAGYSATVFAKTLEDCQIGVDDDYLITTVELIEKRVRAAQKSFVKYNVSGQIKLLEGDASKVLKTIIKDMDHLPEEELFDFVFIDCAKSRYMEFFQSALQITRSEAIIVCDNVFLGGRTVSDSFIARHREKTSTVKMREFVNYLKLFDDHIKTSLFNIGDGLTVSYISKD